MDNIPNDTRDLIKKSLTFVQGVYWRSKYFSELSEKLEAKNIAWFYKYGEFKFENNDLYLMIEEEIIDAINYSCYEMIKCEKLWKTEQLPNIRVVINKLTSIYTWIQEIKINDTIKLEKHFNS
jgi:hypothetical protein